MRTSRTLYGRSGPLDVAVPRPPAPGRLKIWDVHLPDALLDPPGSVVLGIHTTIVWTSRLRRHRPSAVMTCVRGPQRETPVSAGLR